MIVENEKQYKKVIEKALKCDLLAMDVETEEFSKEKTHAFELPLYGIGIYGKGVEAYIPVEYLNEAFQEVLDTVQLVFHNAKFDITVTKRAGYRVDKILPHDTMIMSWLLNSSRSSHSLKYLAEKVLLVKDVIKYADLRKRPEFGTYQMFPDQFKYDYQKWVEELGNYCVDDCRNTYKLFQRFKKKMEKYEGMWELYDTLERPFILVLMVMENMGVRIDEDYLKRIGKEMESDIIQCQAQVWKEAGKEFDINSAKQLSQILFIEKGYTLPDGYKTPKGALSTNVSALEYLSEKENCILSTAVLTYRKLAKLHSTYVKGLLGVSKDGTVHASFLQHGTRTGRLSSSRPNLQNIPTRDDKYDIRRAFIPREGCSFIISDYSQIELRVIAFVSKDPALIQAYKDGKDMHQVTADQLSCNRKTAKAVNFGIAYGQSAFGLSKGIGIPVEEAERFINTYFSKFKKLETFIAQTHNTVQKRYAIKTILKRIRHFPELAGAKRDKNYALVEKVKRQAVNTCIQGSAGDIIKVAMRNLAPKLVPFGAYILLQIHDELIIEVPKDKAEEVAKVVKYEMENALSLGEVPLVTEPEIVDRWKK